MALLCLPRAGRPDGDGSLWAWAGVGLLRRAVGFVMLLSIVRLEQPLPYLSGADAFWLATSRSRWTGS